MACWVSGTNSATLERERARAHQSGEVDSDRDSDTDRDRARDRNRDREAQRVVETLITTCLTQDDLYFHKRIRDTFVF